MSLQTLKRNTARCLLGSVTLLNVVAASQAIESERLQQAINSVTKDVAPIEGPKPEPEPEEKPEALHPPRTMALLETIAFAEGTWDWSKGEIDFSMRFSDRLGYGTLDVTKPHPRQVRGSRYSYYRSDASGAFQFLSTTWAGLFGGHNMTMTPNNQMEGAIRLARSVGYRFDLGFYNQAWRLAPIWASIPTRHGYSFYGQPSKSLSSLNRFYEARLKVHQQSIEQPLAA